MFPMFVPGPSALGCRPWLISNAPLPILRGSFLLGPRARMEVPHSDCGLSAGCSCNWKHSLLGTERHSFASLLGITIVLFMVSR